MTSELFWQRFKPYKGVVVSRYFPKPGANRVIGYDVAQRLELIADTAVEAVSTSKSSAH